MKFERRIYFGFLIIFLCFLPIVVTAFFSIREVVGEENSVLSTNARATVLAERLRYIGSAESSLMPVFVLTGDTRLIPIFKKQNEDFQNLVDSLKVTDPNPDAQKLFLEIEETSKRLAAFDEPGIQLRVAGKSASEVHNFFTENAAPEFEKLQILLDKLATKEVENLRVAKASVASSVRLVMYVLGILSLLALLLCSLVVRLVSKVIRQKRVYDEAQKALMEQEKTISRARKEIVETVSHDLKNPLSTIKMSVEMMLDEISEQPHLKQGLEISLRAANTMEKLIKDLLDNAKHESGKINLDIKTCNAQTLIKNLVKAFHPLARTKHINLSLKSDERISLDCDSGRIEQVLSNLIGNAIKFTPAGGEIKVSLTSMGQKALFVVEDNGPGIEPAAIAHIFERYWQVGQTAKLGTGLGLSIAKTIIKGHEGDIWVESTLGKGSKFYVTLGLRRRESRANEPIQILKIRSKLFLFKLEMS